ncbi:hypothetical protein [uncultured Spirosoma sp.]|uniref:hypothetical protein n=1 Tax=uncultured Spirosoma sp. TaxID=278208 RepID=UPI0025846AD5|nr:hypothetical protein [uncultured Spirosoma sp.]
MSTTDSFPYGLQDTRYLFWIWFSIALICLLIVLAGIIGVDVIRDWRFFNRFEQPTKPTPRPRF